MGSTKVEAPEIKPIDIGASITQAATGYESAAPAMIRTEETLRPAMQKLALADAKISLLGGTPELLAARDEAQSLLDVQQEGRRVAETAILDKIKEIENREFNVENQRARWETAKGDYETHLTGTDNLIKASKDQDVLNNFKRDYPELLDNRGNPKTSVTKQQAKSVDQAGRDAHKKASTASNSIKRLPEGTLQILENWRKTEAGTDTGTITSQRDELERLGKIKTGLEGSIRTVTSELAGTDAEISAYKREAFEGETKLLVNAQNEEIKLLKNSGQFSDKEIGDLQNNLQTASDAVLAGSPGMLDLAEYAVQRQAAVGEKLKRAAAENEFHTIQEIAPELVEMYRESDPGSVDLADLAADRAKEMILRKDAGYTEQQTSLKELRKSIGLPPDPDSLETKVQSAVSDLIEQKTLGSPEAQQSLTAQVGALISGPAQGAAEKKLLEAYGKGPSAEAQKLSTFGQEQMAAEAPPVSAAETALIGAAARPTEATELKEFGADQMAATGRTASPVETALGTAASDRLGYEQREAGTGEGAIAQKGIDLLGQTQADPSTVQQAMATAATGGLEAPVREASETEKALGTAARGGLTQEQRGAGPGEQALAAQGLGMIAPKAPVVSPVQQTMADAAIRDMDAEARGASQVEQALGLSAMRGMDAQQRAASPEEAALQARISELIGGAGTLSPLERRQVEQEMLALQQRQGRARDTGAAAAVSGRMAEARRADLGQDLGMASGLLGQQDALIQARVQEQLQALGMGQQGAVGVAGMEATRQDAMLRQRALGQQAGISAEQIALAQAQQDIAERQTGAGFLGQAESLEQARIQEQLQRQAQATQGAIGAGQLEAGREVELLQRQAQGIQAGTTAEQMELARQQQAISQMQAGAGLVTGAEALQQSRIQELMAQQQTGAGMAATVGQLEAQRVAELQAQQGMGMQAAAQAGTLGLQGQQQQLSALEAAGNLANQRGATLQAQRGMGMQAVGQAAGLGLQQGQQELAALEASAQQQAQRQIQRLQGVELAGGIAGQEFGQMVAGRQLGMEGLTAGAGIYADQAGRDLQEQSMVSQMLGQEQAMEAERLARNVAMEQQGLGALGQAFGMSKAVAPDVGAFFGRPASQAAGLEVLGMGQQQAMYGATPKGADYGQGVNIAMAQQANQAGLDAAAIGATAQAKAGKSAMIGAIGGGLLGCWVAREVYGNDNPMWMLFREWMLNKAPSWFRNLYIRHGAKFAKFISNKPFIKKLIRKWMTSIVRKNYGYVR